MSSTNYDVELNITYDDAYKHYIPNYRISVPYYGGKKYWDQYAGQWDYWWYRTYEVALSFDDGNESTVSYAYGPNPGSKIWNTQNKPAYDQTTNPDVPDTGIFTKAYFRNPHRTLCTFTPSNCFIEPFYNIKAAFEIQFNSTGFVANQNAQFHVSTVQKNTYKQYEWHNATVHYKKSTESTYQSVSGTISGTWSDYTISTNLSFEDGYTYDVQISAVSDDLEYATTAVAQFSTTDAAAVATCIAPVGAFLQGEATFVWSHTTAYGTPQYAYDLQYSTDNGGTWNILQNHAVTQANTYTTTLASAGAYKWRVRTYNSNNVPGEWAEASFINNMPATPPTNLQVTTKGRPTVSWTSSSQAAYQVQLILSDAIVYDSGAVYSPQTNHFVNQYFNDERSYVVRVRIYNALGEVSDWSETGYQQPSVTNVEFTIISSSTNGVIIDIVPNPIFVKYYILRNGKAIGTTTTNSYSDIYAVGLTNYAVVGVTSDDQSDIQTTGYNVQYKQASIVTLEGTVIAVNKRVDNAYEIQTTNSADINKVEFIGDSVPSHYVSKMRLKSFTVYCFDEQGICESLLGSVVFYADNFNNGGYCVVTSYDKTDNFVKNSNGAYANEVTLILEVTNYDDSIEYEL